MTAIEDRARPIFLAALGRAPEEWPAVLDEACAGDAALRARVDGLLRAHVEMGSIRVGHPATAATEAPLREAPGSVVGPYKLLEQIGEGGMGVVFLAEQTRPVRRQVALKVIKAGMDTRQVVARFEAERQALALMDHPNIAKVLDAGATDSGRPFFVMELVKGVPITQFCDQTRFTPRERLGLFVQVCQAVQHAHTKGIIHRDLKPSNVLVALYDGKPVPKVIDFGVAKATGGRLTEATIFTGFGSVVGTPEYMAPEQAELNQLDVDTRADVYSLGVILYELLTGSTPVERKRFKQAALMEVLRVVREEEPPKPSTRLSTTDQLASIAASRGLEPRKLSGQVRGELDWIVMRALEKDRGRRYETANGFAADVRRYLSDEAVQACPPSAAYRLKKFARRNRGGLAVAALVLLFLMLAGSGVGWTVRDRTARYARVAGQVELILAEVDRLEREQKWPEALAEVRRAQAAVAGGEADATTARRVRERLKDLEFLDRLEQIRMQVATWVGRSFDNATANREYARAFREYGADVEAMPTETSIELLKARPGLAFPLAAALDDWVRIRHAASNPDFAGAQRLAEIARGIDPDPLRDRLRYTGERHDAKAIEEHRQRVASIDVRAHHPVTLITLADHLGAANRLDIAVPLLRDAQAAHPGDFWLNFELAILLEKQKDYEGAVRFYTAAAAIRPRSTAALNNLGLALQNRGRSDEAVKAFSKAISLDPQFAYAYNNLGIALADQNKVDEAVAAYRKAVEFDPKAASAYTNLALALRDQKKFTEAVAASRKAVELEPHEPKCHVNLGFILCDGLRDYEGAAACFRKAIEIAPKYAGGYLGLGRVLQEQKQLDDAVAAFRKAIDLDPNDVNAYGGLGNVLCDQDKFDDAVAAYRKATEVDPNSIDAYLNLGAALYHRDKLDEAAAAYRTASELDPKRADSLVGLSSTLQRQNKFDEALGVIQRATALDPQNAGAHMRLGLVLKAQRNWEQARAALERAVSLAPDDAGARSNLAWILGNGPDARFLDLPRALEHLRKATELAPNDRVRWNHLGAIQYRAGMWREALGTLQKAERMESTPDNYHRVYLVLANWRLEKKHEALKHWVQFVAWMDTAAAPQKQESPLLHEELANLRAEAEGLLGPFRDAEAAYREILRVEPKSARAHYGFAALFFQRRQWSEAAAAYAKALELEEPADLWTWLDCANLLVRAGDAEGYRKLCERMLKRFGESRDPDQVAFLAHVAVLVPDALADRDRVVQLAELRMALTEKIDAHRLWSMHVLGLAYYRSGQFDKAVARLEAAQNDPGFQTPGFKMSNWLVLAMCRHRLGRDADAAAAHRSARAILAEEQGDVDGQNPSVQILFREAESLLGKQ